jgi:hypothetical protein
VLKTSHPSQAKSSLNGFWFIEHLKSQNPKSKHYHNLAPGSGGKEEQSTENNKQVK